jgi:alpha-beta hydrolase superfamily lysophospholipase
MNVKKIAIRTIRLLIVFYILICIALFFFQERLIFIPEKLPNDFRFSFNGNFEEINIKTADSKLLNGVLFKADSSKGLIFYLHGNAGSINSWGKVAKTYTDLRYDVFLLDYRGYGKSEGSITSQEQIFGDVQTAYSEMKKKYDENRMIVLGYSIGTGLAAKVASVNNPKMLILQAPYFNLTDMMRHTYPIIPTFLLKYKFQTDKFIRDCKMPVVIFHGDQDEVIYYESSVKLKSLCKESDRLITLGGQGHNGMTYNPEYKAEIEKILTY